MSTVPRAERELAAAQRRQAAITEALDHLQFVDLNGDKIHDLLGILCATAPAAVVAAVHEVLAERA